VAVTNDYLQWVLEQLSGVGRLTTRRMFGAVGIYRGEVFFAIISSDVLYFKVGDANRADYERRGARQFHPYRDRPQLSMNYYEVPADILEDPEECALWAERAIAAAVAKAAAMTKNARRRLVAQPTARGRRR
jgi:DNA transformation protein and related proteins